VLLESVGVHSDTPDQNFQHVDVMGDLLIHANQKGGLFSPHVANTIGLAGKNAEGGIAQNGR
jgi:hypothetical protein